MSKEKVLPILVSLIALFLVGSLVGAWEGPTQEPPQGNTPPPLNSGPEGQSKEGGLVLNTGGAETGLIIDNGVLQFNNSEWGEYDIDGGLYWDKSAGLYIRSSNTSNSQSGGRLIWSGENVHAGNGINISYDGEDEPTISTDSQNLDCTSRSKRIGVGARVWGSGTVYCPSGYKATGGSVRPISRGLEGIGSWPSGNGWSARAFSPCYFCGWSYIRVYVRCCR